MFGFFVGLYFGYSYLTRQGMEQFKKENIVVGVVVLLVGLLGFAWFATYPVPDLGYIQLIISLSSGFTILGITMVLLAIKYNIPRERTLREKKYGFLVSISSALLATIIVIFLSLTVPSINLLPTLFFFILTLNWGMMCFFLWSYIREKFQDGN